MGNPSAQMGGEHKPLSKFTPKYARHLLYGTNIGFGVPCGFPVKPHKLGGGGATLKKRTAAK